MLIYNKDNGLAFENGPCDFAGLKVVENKFSYIMVLLDLS